MEHDLYRNEFDIGTRGERPVMRAPVSDPSSTSNYVFLPKPGMQRRTGLFLIALSFVGFIPLKDIWLWYAQGRPLDPHAFWTILALLSFPFGVLAIINSFRGMPRLVLSESGLEFESTLGKRWAAWDSLEAFSIKTIHAGRSGKKRYSASAKIIGPNASKKALRSKNFLIPDSFELPITELIADVNSARARVIGLPEHMMHHVESSNPLPVGLATYRFPLLTIALLVVLIGVFTLENLFPVTPGRQLAPSIQTLFAFGALSQNAVLSEGEWYRLFTAPLLHADFAHILGNGIALLLGGWFFERHVGRLWFFAFFVIGALGGSLTSLAFGPPNQISVGASGALMGLFAAMYISSYRLASGTADRTRMQIQSLRILIPSLLPQLSSKGGAHIDYFAHFGGAVSCAIIAFVLLKLWPETEPLPQLRKAAIAIATMGALLFLGSSALVAAHFETYKVTMIPQAEWPKTQADRQAHADVLVKRYPEDPRSHLILSEKLLAENDTTGAERELRRSLETAQAHSKILGEKLELIVRNAFAVFLSEHEKKGEAKEIARPVCEALKRGGRDDQLPLRLPNELCQG